MKIFYFGVEPVVSNCLAAQYCVDSGTQNTRANLAYGQRLCVPCVSLLTSRIKYTENAEIFCTPNTFHSFFVCVTSANRFSFLCNSSIHIKIEFKSNLRSHQRFGYFLLIVPIKI